MEFVFYEKSNIEADIITTILSEENITHKTLKKVLKTHLYDDEEDEDITFIEDCYDIHCYTDLAHFDFVKHVINNKLTNRVNLERSYLKKTKGRKKNVQRVSKKGVTDTTNRDKS